MNVCLLFYIKHYSIIQDNLSFFIYLFLSTARSVCLCEIERGLLNPPDGFVILSAAFVRSVSYISYIYFMYRIPRRPCSKKYKERRRINKKFPSSNTYRSSFKNVDIKSEPR